MAKNTTQSTIEPKSADLPGKAPQPAPTVPATPDARLVRVTGLVQGVGFRPTVYRIAMELGLSGYVFNDEAGVGVHLEGTPEALDRFPEKLLEEKPPLARIDSIDATPAPVENLQGFEITPSRSGGRVTTAITADAATCDACYEDMFDPSNRRWRYAFTNCTHCGPRFTITRALPYDRPQTSMARFPMCPDCLHEYEDPLDRRFHAQPNACPVCGPQLLFTDIHGEAIKGDPIALTIAAIRRGEIVAMKGIGGFHLVCDAQNPEAVTRLRARKHRDEKPLAIMCANIPSAEAWVSLNAEEKRLLTSPAHPIVLARKRGDLAENALPGIADGLVEIGVMLPYTPLHALLFHEYLGRPTGTHWLKNDVVDLVLVMTSANPGGEPLVIENDEAIRRLGNIADCFLMHNRDILIRCDDSVARVCKLTHINSEGQPEEVLRPIWVRRARGRTPEAVKLGSAQKTGQTVAVASAASREETKVAPPINVLAMGPYLKNTAALTRGNEAFLTQHVGDLENASTAAALQGAVAHLESILEVDPDVFAGDLHPDFFSTRLAKRLADEREKPLLLIPHHAAHIGVVMAELGRTEPTYGLALDGVGLGPDGGVWGGELLCVSPLGFERIGHLSETALPGGDRAAREPWRMGASVLVDLGHEDLIEAWFGDMPNAHAMANFIRSPITQKTSAAGRYFDAASALLGITLVQHDEATAAMRLEALATEWERVNGVVSVEACKASVTLGLEAHHDNVLNSVLDMRPLFSELVQNRLNGMPMGEASAHFIRGFAARLTVWTFAALEAREDIQRAKAQGERPIVALTGGCFLNRILLADISAGLARAGFDPRPPLAVPPGDGGLALGQAWLAKCFFEAYHVAHPGSPLPAEPEYGFGTISKTSALA